MISESHKNSILALIKIIGAIFLTSSASILSIFVGIQIKKLLKETRFSSSYLKKLRIEEEWKNIFQHLGSLSKSDSIPAGLVTSYSHNTFNGKF